VDAVEETVTAGGSTLSYDASSGQYIYVWKTEKSWAASCRQLVVKFADGTSAKVANFNSPADLPRPTKKPGSRRAFFAPSRKINRPSGPRPRYGAQRRPAESACSPAQRSAGFVECVSCGGAEAASVIRDNQRQGRR
jgi:hypothetical protein